MRHDEPVIIRTDEIGTFAAATRKNSDNGDRLLGELKRAVSGETLGSGYATDEKNLRCQPLTYRAAGRPGRRPHQGPGLSSPTRVEGCPSAYCSPPWSHLPIRPLPPASPLSRRCPGAPPPMISPLGSVSFIDSPDVSKWLMATFWQQRTEPPGELEAHATYLQHMLAATLALLDGRWVIGAGDLEMAGMVMDVSRATRGGLLEVIRAEERKVGRARAAQAAQTAVTVDAAKRQQKDQRWIAQQETAIVEAATATPGVTVKALRDKVRSTNRGLWSTALENVKAKGLVVEELQSGQGESARCLFLPTSI